MQLFFWTALIVFLNSYILYPLFVFTIAKFQKKKEQNKYFPNVSIIIAAYNEEKVISERVKNLAKLEYDFSKLEVLIGSDNSSDNTNTILLDLEKDYSWLHVHIFNERQGKAGVINSLAKHCQNEIMIFSDANTHFEKSSVKELVKHFENNDIGAVCGKLILKEDSDEVFEGAEEQMYWEIESRIKMAEGKIGIVIGSNGGNFALRNNLFTKIPIERAVTDDLYLSLLPLKKGKRVVFEEKSYAFEQVGKKVAEEFRRKIRFASTNFQTLFFFLDLFSFRKPILAYALFSHKLSRWLNPWFIIIIFISSLFLFSEDKFYFYFVILQLIFYFFGLLGYLLSLLNKKIQPFSIIYYFLVSNFALLIGLIKFVFNKHTVIWTPTKR